VADRHRAGRSHNLHHVVADLLESRSGQLSFEVDRRTEAEEDGFARAQPAPLEGSRAEEVLARVQPHVLVAAIPVQDTLHFHPDTQPVEIRGGPS